MLPQATHPYGPPGASSTLTLQQHNQAEVSPLFRRCSRSPIAVVQEHTAILLLSA